MVSKADVFRAVVVAGVSAHTHAIVIVTKNALAVLVAITNALVVRIFAQAHAVVHAHHALERANLVQVHASELQRQYHWKKILNNFFFDENEDDDE